MANESKEDKPADETTKLICSLISLIYSIQAGITSEPANDNNNDDEGGDGDSVA